MVTSEPDEPDPAVPDPSQAADAEWVNPMLLPPDDDDHSEFAEWRREVLDFVRGFGVELPTPPSVSSPPPPSRPPRTATGPESSAVRPRRRVAGDPGLDLRAASSLVLVRVGRLVARRVSGSGERRETRDLVLAEIGRAGAALPRRVARTLAIRRQTFWGVVRGAERAGLVTRRRHPGDHRTCLLELTPEGREAAHSAVAAWREVEDRTRERFTAEEWAELRRLLRKLARWLDR